MTTSPSEIPAPSSRPNGTRGGGRPNRPARPQLLLEVVSREHIGPHLVRLRLTCVGPAPFVDNGHTDKYLKFLFIDPAAGVQPPYDLAQLKADLPADRQPVRRTYTVRSFDADSGEIAVDFVVHGTIGIAAPWAAAANPGDRVAAVGPGGGYTPDLQAAWHLIAGDLTALPAIAAALEHLPESARGVAYVQVPGPHDELELRAPTGVTVKWLHADAQATTALADAIAAEPWPDGDIQVFAHGERESVKAMRQVLRQRGIPHDRLSISGYWALGRTEDAFQAEKRLPIGVID